MKRKLFKFKILNGAMSSEVYLQQLNSLKFKQIKGADGVVFALDYTDLSAETIREYEPSQIKLITDKKCRLLLSENKNSQLELSDVHIICSLVQAVFGGDLLWDIIHDESPNNQDSEDVNGYLVLFKATS